MNESLAQMIKETTVEEVSMKPEELTIPSEPVPEKTKTEVKCCTTPSNVATISLTKFNTWFESNASKFSTINQVKMSIRGIDPKETIIISALKRNGEKDSEGNPKRELHIFENANDTVVLDLPAIDIHNYTNGYMILHQINDIYIKSYGVRGGIVCVLCKNVDGLLIPYNITRASKRDTTVDITTIVPEIESKINLPANLDDVQLLYKQSKKVISTFSTNLTVIQWLINRQIDIVDVNHQLQIDGVILDMLSK